MKVIHNKLIRDKIIDIIEKDGKKASYHYLNEEDYRACLKKKLLEEASEVNKANSKEELIKEIADVLEVIDGLKCAYHIEDATIERIKEDKASKNGKFSKGIFLEYVIEEEK